MLVGLGLTFAIYVFFVAALLIAGRHTDAQAVATFIPDCLVLFSVDERRDCQRYLLRRHRRLDAEHGALRLYPACDSALCGTSAPFELLAQGRVARPVGQNSKYSSGQSDPLR